MGVQNVFYEINKQTCFFLKIRSFICFFFHVFYFLSRPIILFNNKNISSVSKTSFIQNVYDTQYKQITHHLAAGREKQSDQLFAPVLNSNAVFHSSFPKWKIVSPVLLMTRHQNDVIGVKRFKTCFFLVCFKTVLYGNVLKHFENIPHLGYHIREIFQTFSEPKTLHQKGDEKILHASKSLTFACLTTFNFETLKVFPIYLKFSVQNML